MMFEYLYTMTKAYSRITCMDVPLFLLSYPLGSTYDAPRLLWGGEEEIPVQVGG